MKWLHVLIKSVPIFMFVLLVISLLMIYGNRQNIKANELSRIPEIKYEHILNWNVENDREKRSFERLQSELIAHYDLDKKYYTDRKYTDVFIYQGKFIICDRKYQMKVEKNKDYHMFAVDMNENANPKYFKFEDPLLKRTYEKLF